MKEYTVEILFTLVIIFVLGGLGYIIGVDQHNVLLFQQQCVDSGMQYIGGNCVK